ncbi:MAG: ubiquinol-cytochrome c reductase iron-sulfur subunit N-terminal domain-containing protein, partial [Candidatus Puniceispirillaceae bacterium]
MAKSDKNQNPAKGDVQEPGRRDFFVVATYAMAGLGAAAVAWPLI